MRLAVLMIEDSFFSADMNVREIKKAGFELDYRIVASAKSMAEALEEKDWDIIISGNSMKNFDASMALKVRNKISSKIPFIIISEDVTDEEICNAMGNGCSTYLSKERLQELRNLVTSITSKSL